MTTMIRLKQIVNTITKRRLALVALVLLSTAGCNSEQVIGGAVLLGVPTVVAVGKEIASQSQKTEDEIKNLNLLIQKENERRRVIEGQIQDLQVKDQNFYSLSKPAQFQQITGGLKNGLRNIKQQTQVIDVSGEIVNRSME